MFWYQLSAEFHFVPKSSCIQNIPFIWTSFCSQIFKYNDDQPRDESWALRLSPMPQHPPSHGRWNPPVQVVTSASPRHPGRGEGGSTSQSATADWFPSGKSPCFIGKESIVPDSGHVQLFKLRNYKRVSPSKQKGKPLKKKIGMWILILIQRWMENLQYIWNHEPDWVAERLRKNRIDLAWVTGGWPKISQQMNATKSNGFLPNRT